MKELNQVTNPKAEHYIKVSESYNVEEIKKEFSNLKYDFVSSVSGGVAWINKDDIYAAWAKRGK